MSDEIEGEGSPASSEDSPALEAIPEQAITNSTDLSATKRAGQAGSHPEGPAPMSNPKLSLGS